METNIVDDINYLEKLKIVLAGSKVCEVSNKEILNFHTECIIKMQNNQREKAIPKMKSYDFFSSFPSSR